MTSPGSLTSHAWALPCIARSRARLRDIAAGRSITERSACGIVTGPTAASYVIKQKDGSRSSTRSSRTSRCAEVPVGDASERSLPSVAARFCAP